MLNPFDDLSFSIFSLEIRGRQRIVDCWGLVKIFSKFTLELIIFLNALSLTFGHMIFDLSRLPLDKE